MKNIIILVSLFLVYVLFVNLFGSYTLVYTKKYEPKGDGNYGFKQTIGTSQTLTVEIKRARMLGGLLPTYIFIGKEIKIKYLNYVVVITFVGLLSYFVYREYEKRKEDYEIYEELINYIASNL